MAMYKFGFAGGVKKHPQERVISKFLLFHLLPSRKIGKMEERIFFQSLRSGFVTECSPVIAPKNAVPSPEIGEMNYRTEYPNFKLFTLVEGFGVQKQFYSFYLALDIHESMMSILPLCSIQQNQFFIGRFRFMSIKEVKEALGEDSVSFNFYKKQLPLAKSLMSRIVIEGHGIEAGVNPASLHSVRKIRF